MSATCSGGKWLPTLGQVARQGVVVQAILLHRRHQVSQAAAEAPKLWVHGHSFLCPLNQILNTAVDCEADGAEVYLDSRATVAKNRVNYEGCPGSCPKYSLGLGKQKVSCHVLRMQAEGKVDQTSATIDQWVSLQGPC